MARVHALLIMKLVVFVDEETVLLLHPVMSIVVRSEEVNSILVTI